VFCVFLFRKATRTSPFWRGVHVIGWTYHDHMTYCRQILYVVRPTITTSTCFPEPATSSGHLGLLHWDRDFPHNEWHMTTAPHAHVLLFAFGLHVERSPLALKIRKFSVICFQPFLPTFEPVSYVKNPNFPESGEGEEERMEWLKRSIHSHKCKNLILQGLVVVRNTSHQLLTLYEKLSDLKNFEADEDPSMYVKESACVRGAPWSCAETRNSSTWGCNEVASVTSGSTPYIVLTTPVHYR